MTLLVDGLQLRFIKRVDPTHIVEKVICRTDLTAKRVPRYAVSQFISKCRFTAPGKTAQNHNNTAIVIGDHGLDIPREIIGFTKPKLIRREILVVFLHASSFFQLRTSAVLRTVNCEL